MSSKRPKDEAVSLGNVATKPPRPMTPVDCGDVQAEYQAALQAVAVYDISDRGLIEVVGSDRSAWLNNLVTNSVKTLQPGHGCYAFGISDRGRIVFDCNILVHQEKIWLDVDRQLMPKVLMHLERYHVSEDVHLMDISENYYRVSLLGPRSGEIAEKLGAAELAAMSEYELKSVTVGGKPCLIVRHDLGELVGAEIFFHRDDARTSRLHLLEMGRPFMRLIGKDAVEVLRIETGIPVYGQDIDEDVLPAETGQAARAVSYTKGCYLGQEIVERMRSRGMQARTLVGFRLSGESEVISGARLVADEADVGCITSMCNSPRAGGKIALGYVKTGYATLGTRLRVDSPKAIDAEVVSLPFRREAT